MQSRFPHVQWLDLNKDNILVECAIMQVDGNGNTHYIRLNELDDVDKRRIASMLTSRTAPQFALWDLMSQVTLGNGLNALVYFQQYVKIMTAGGHIMSPRPGEVGGAV